MNKEKGNYYCELIKTYLNERDSLEYVKYQKFIQDYKELLRIHQEYEYRIKEFSSINAQALSKITEGFLSSKESIDKNKVDELNEENSKLVKKIEKIENNYHETKEKLIQITTKYEILMEDIEILKEENSQLNELLTNEKQAKQQLNDEHQVLQSVLIAHEKEIFNLKEENELLLNELLRIKEKNMNEVLEKNDNNKKTVKSYKLSKDNVKSLKTTANSSEISTSYCPNNIVKKISLNDDIYSIKACDNYAAISTGDNVALYTLKNDLSYFGLLKGCTGMVHSVDINSHETQVLTGSSDRSCRIWDIENCKLIDCLMGHEDKVMSAKFVPHDSNRVISGSRDRNIKLWDIITLSCLHTYYIPSACIDLVVMTSNSGISAHMDKTCRLWDLRSNHYKSSINIPDKITSLAYSCNTFVVSSRNNKLYYYDIRNLKPNTLSHNYFSVAFDWSKICMSCDGQYVVAGSRSSQLFAWNLGKNDCRTLDGHKFPVVCVAWSDKRTNILSADCRRNVFLWS